MCAKPIAKSAAGPRCPIRWSKPSPIQKPRKICRPLVHSQKRFVREHAQPALRRWPCTPAKIAQKDRNSITDPIFVASTYTFADTQSVIDYIEQKQPREEYGRYGNPSERVVERKLAALEGGESGPALLHRHVGAGRAAVVEAERRRRSHFLRRVLPPQPRILHASILSRFGVVTRQVPACDYDAMEAAITPLTKLLISESPTNPHLSIVDLERFADIGRRHDVETLIDATLGTPYNIRPLAAGIDYVLHSATKYLGGHNDLLAGTLDQHRREAGAGPQAARHHRRHQLAAQYLSAAARPENVRAPHAAAQRKRPGRGRVFGSASAHRKGVLSRPAVASVLRSRQAHHARLRRPGDVPGARRRLAANRPRSSIACKFRASRRAWAASNR